MKKEPQTALNVRNFPRTLLARVKAKAALEEKTMERFVQEVLAEATKDVARPKPAK
jgi:hypothetical protein